MSDTTPFYRTPRVLLIVLALWFVGSVTFAIKAEKPWGKTVTKRVEKHQDLQPKEYAVIGLWWGAVVNAGLLAVLLGTAKRWVPEGRGGGTSQQSTVISQRKTGLVVWGPRVMLLGILVGAAWLRAPRLAHSLWNDEEYAMRKFAHGAWEQEKDGQWAFQPVTWTDTLFENRNGNNHLLNSLITREALVIWRAATHAPREAFSETALRMPAFVAGLLTVAMIYLLGCRVSGPGTGTWVGLAAAALFALCPWHVRYAVEAKGYSFMLLFVCTAIYGLIRAIEENRTRWWLLFALSEAAFLLSFAGSIYVAAALNLFAAAEIFKKKRLRLLWTLMAFNILAATPVVQWMLPSVPQLLHYLRSEGSLHLGLGWPWLRDFFSGLAIGFQYNNPAPAEHAGTSWLMETTTHPWIAYLMGAVGTVALLGSGMALFRSMAARLAVVAPMAAVVVAYAHNALAGTPMVVWYLLYVIVPVSLAVPLAVMGLAGRHRQVVAGVLMVAMFAGYAAAIWNSVQCLRLQARQPIREAVAFAHSQDANSLTAVLGVSDRQMQSYDPKVTVLDDRKELASVITTARAAGHPLFVYVCGREAILLGTEGKLLSKQPVLDALQHGLPAEETAGSAVSFAEAAHFSGTEALFSYHVYRLNP